MTHDRRTHDLPTSLLTLAQQCEAEVTEWLDAFPARDLDIPLAVLLVMVGRVRQLRLHSAHYRLARQGYIDQHEDGPDLSTLRAAMRSGRAYIESSEAKRLGLVAELVS